MSTDLQTRFGKKIPWIMGKGVRIPKINYPIYREGQLSIATPGRSFILLALYLFLFWLMCGGIYISIRNPITLGQDNAGNAMWLYPSTSEAFIIESVVAGFLMFLAGTGFFILYQSTKHAFNYAYSLKLLIFALVAIVGGFALLQYMIGVKTGVLK